MAGGKVGILMEKPDAGQRMAEGLGGRSGTFQGTPYVVMTSLGHLLEFRQPHEQVPSDKSALYKSWAIENLPWDHREMSWERTLRIKKKKNRDGKIIDDPEDARFKKQFLAAIADAFKDCDELVIGTDIDPTGEGDLIAWEVLEQISHAGKKFSRMYFTDDEPESLKKAFIERQPIESQAKHGDYQKAQFRSQWDFMSQQFTRIATKLTGNGIMPRQGRLKSYVVVLVGDEQKAHDEWVKVSSYQNQFVDENGVKYSDPNEEFYPKKADVPQTYHSSAVVKDSSSMKSTPPPKLLDFAALGSLLSKKGVKAKDFSETYQKMYEAKYLSYPRTEDKTITTEQYNQMLPLVDAIADVVGANKALLTVRTPRKTHVKDSGAHGANRPGKNVPDSLEQIEATYGTTGRMIYETLGRNFLTMFAPDYEYEQQKGHLADYPSFTGTANVEKVKGYKAVFVIEDEDVDEEASEKGLGTNAEPTIHEKVPPRPPKPSIDWVCKQLDKRDVGTPATRFTTVMEMCDEKHKHPILVADNKGFVTFAESGAVSYLLLPGTHIGAVETTEAMQADMRAVKDGTKSADEALEAIKTYIVEDIKTMTKNAENMRKVLKMPEPTDEFVKKEKYEGKWNGEDISFTRVWGGGRFTDDQCEALLRGEEVSLMGLTNKNGAEYGVKGKLARQSYNGHEYVGFEKISFISPDVLPPIFLEHKFTDAERADLEAGKEIMIKGFKSKKTGKTFDAKTSFKKKAGEESRSIQFNFDKK